MKEVKKTKPTDHLTGDNFSTFKAENPKSGPREDDMELNPKKELMRSLEICDEYIGKIRAMIKDMPAESLRDAIPDSDSLAIESEELHDLIRELKK
jgi:hypothetical protein